MDNVKKVAIYVRVRNTKKRALLEKQLVSLRTFCQQSGFETVREYIDVGTDNRQAMQMLIEDASHGEFDTVMVDRVGRISENCIAALSFSNRLQEFGVGVYAVKDQSDARTSTGRFAFIMLASATEYLTKCCNERFQRLYKTAS